MSDIFRDSSVHKEMNVNEDFFKIVKEVIPLMFHLSAAQTLENTE